MNTLKEDFILLKNQMLKDKKLDKKLQNEVEKIFILGAMATHIAMMECHKVKNPDEQLNDLFVFITSEAERLGE